MAMYAPIRDAFADLNKLVSDSQQWDERHAAAQSDREFQQQMLTSQLEQRQFNNDMQVQEMGLKKSGEARAADQFSFNRMHANRSWDAATVRAGQDTEVHRANMAKSKMEREQMAMSLKEEKDFIAARDGELGRVTQEVFVDPIGRATQAGAVISQKIAGLEARMRKMNPNNNRDLIAAGPINQQINAAKAELDQATAGTRTSEERVATWRKQADAARELAPQWNRKEPATGKMLMGIADDYDARADKELASTLKNTKANAKKLSDDKALQRYDRFAKHYGKMDANNQIFLSPAAKGRVTIAHNWATQLSLEGNMTDGQLLSQGWAAVDIVEGNLGNDIELIDADYQDGLIDEEEMYMYKAQRTNQFIQKFGYDPSGTDVPEVLPEDM